MRHLPAAYRKAVMELDDKTLMGPEVLAAFRQSRKLADWSDPGAAGQHYSTFIARYMKGDMGMLLMGGWAQGVFKHAGFRSATTSLARHRGRRQDGVRPELRRVHLLAEAATGVSGRTEAAGEDRHEQGFRADVFADHRLVPVRTDTDLSAPGFSDGQREAARRWSRR